jgi:hypothetical protein
MMYTRFLVGRPEGNRPLGRSKSVLSEIYLFLSGPLILRERRGLPTGHFLSLLVSDCWLSLRTVIQ